MIPFVQLESKVRDPGLISTVTRSEALLQSLIVSPPLYPRTESKEVPPEFILIVGLPEPAMPLTQFFIKTVAVS